MQKITIDITGMHCRSCELLIEDELLKIPGVKKAKTNFRKDTAEVFYGEEKPNEAVFREAIRNAGYEIGKVEKLWFSRDIGAWTEALFALGVVFVLFVIAKSLGLFEISLGSSDRLSSLPFVLLLGLVAGFSTCMAIVGGMVLATSARFSEMHPEASTRKKFLPHLYFNIGRIGGFMVLGAVLGWAGSIFQLSPFFVGVLTALVGGVMFLLGLQLLELFPTLSAWKLMLPKGIASALGVQSHTKKEYSHSRSMLIGAVTFFLPCGFTQLTQLFVVTVGSPLTGALTMGAFALGTAPGLLGIGGIAAAAQGWFRRFFFKAAGIIVIALGVFNFHNGVVLVSLDSDRQAESETVEDAAASVKDAQVIRVVQRGDGYSPTKLTVKKGQLVRLIVDSQDSYTCAVSFMIPKVGVRQALKPGENVFTFTPAEAGSIPFSCSMGMYRGVINVIE